MIQLIELKDIQVDSIVSYNVGSEQFSDWQPTRLDWQDIKWLTETPIEFNAVHEPIPLTEKILVEWCGCKKDSFLVSQHQYRIGERLIIIRDGKFVDYGSSVELPYLYILQRFILALTNEPLKIEMK